MLKVDYLNSLIERRKEGNANVHEYFCDTTKCVKCPYFLVPHCNEVIYDDLIDIILDFHGELVGKSSDVEVEKRMDDLISGLEKDDFGTLAICAVRYCHGRQTYMPDLVRSIIRPRLKELNDKDLNVMIEDCDFQERMNLYGDECIDKQGWLRWKADLVAERRRRTEDE